MATVGVEGKVKEHARLVNRAIEAYLPRVEGACAASLRDYLERGPRRSRPVFAVQAPMRHAVAAGGKRIRPILCLLAHEAVGGRAEDALPTAAGIEFLHTFTLVHDDIMDGAFTRRSRPTAGALWGSDIAITVGDALFALAFDAFSANAEVPAVPPGRVLEVLRRASRVCLDLAQGQALDLLHAKRDDVGVDEYLEMVRLKTGVLLEFSLSAGALLADADAREVAALGAFGAPLGIAFQIRDDLLDLLGDSRRTGKPVGGDVRAGKRTLLVAHAFRESPKAGRLAQILDAPPEATSDEDVAEAVRILEEAGSVRFAQEQAEAHLCQAKQALARIPGSARELADLGGVADYVIRRED